MTTAHLSTSSTVDETWDPPLNNTCKVTELCISSLPQGAVDVAIEVGQAKIRGKMCVHYFGRQSTSNDRMHADLRCVQCWWLGGASRWRQHMQEDQQEQHRIISCRFDDSAANTTAGHLISISQEHAHRMSHILLSPSSAIQMLRSI